MYAKSLHFFKFHYTEANPLTPADIYGYDPEQNLFSNVKAIKQKKKSKLFLSNIWVLPLMALLQPYDSKSTPYPV